MRYADDFVILCRTRAQAEQALAKVREIMGLLRLQLHPTKTRLVELGLGKEGFTFLGCYLRIVRSHFKGKLLSVSLAVPASDEGHPHPHPRSHRAASMGGDEGHPRSDPGTQPGAARMGRLLPNGQRLGQVQPGGRLRARAAAYGCSMRRGGQRRWRPGGRPFNPREWPHRRLVEEHGLYQLLGTIRYPGGTHAA